jgi:hypothetical protein
MKYILEMSSGAMIYIPSFTKIIRAFKCLWGGFIENMVIS